MRITGNNLNVVMIDVQEKLHPVMAKHAALEKRLAVLVKGLAMLGVTPIVTEQSPEKLGTTIKSLKELLPDADLYAKRAFSCFGEGAFESKILSAFKKRLVLCGIEAHVCVLQTALDALDLGLDVIIVEDAVASRNDNDKAIALKRLEQSGVQFTTVESLLFELLKTSEHEKFKEISQLLK